MTLIRDYSSAQWAREKMENVLPQIQRQLRNSTTEHISCYILGQKLPAVKITGLLPKDDEMTYDIHINGTINGQSFYLQVYSDKDIKSNEDIPPGIRQIIKLEK